MEISINNIVFWGEDAFSNVVLNSLIKSGYNVQMVVTPQYETPIYKRLELTCKKNGIEFIRAKAVNGNEVFEKLKKYKPDLCVICHFERLIKPHLLSIPRYGFINVHPSLLPDYRGMSPQHWPIVNGESKTGITCHYVDEGTDTGDIILQREIPLNDKMYVSDLQKIWLMEYKTIVTEAIEKIKENAPVAKQKNLPGSYYGKLKECECIINHEASVHTAYNMVRGMSLPYCGARFDNMIILRAHIKDVNETTGSFPTIEFHDGTLVLEQYKNIK